MEAICMNYPKCCDQEMVENLDLGRFLELKCEVCSDVVYVKAAHMAKVMIQ
jgi:hypothetical protein